MLARQLGQLTVGTLPGDRPSFFLLADHVPVTPGKRRQPLQGCVLLGELSDADVVDRELGVRQQRLQLPVPVFNCGEFV